MSIGLKCLYFSLNISESTFGIHKTLRDSLEQMHVMINKYICGDLISRLKCCGFICIS